jgi:hypothetical protein
MELKEMRCEGEEQIDVVGEQRPGMDFTDDSNKTSLSIKGRQFLDQPTDYYFLQTQAAP